MQTGFATGNDMVHCVIVAAILIQSAYVLCYQEDLPYQNADDDSLYLYMDTRSLKDTPDKPREYDIEARRRSILEKNFVRLGRRDPLIQQQQQQQQPQSLRNNNKYDNEYDDYNYNEEYMRPTRSGSDKNDNFIRFGRARSDFVRFGRDSNRLHNKDTSFLRFGRSVQSKLRNKRDTYADEQEHNNKRSNSNFLRFGKSDHFMRFGRKDDEITTTATTANNNHERTRLTDLMEVFREHPEYLLLLFRDRQLIKSPSCISQLY